MDSRIKEIEEMLNHPDFLTRQKNGLMLNKHHIEVLERFKIEWQKYSTFSSLVYEIEEILTETEDEELEKLANDDISKHRPTFPNVVNTAFNV